jgi:hypothetical protein
LIAKRIAATQGGAGYRRLSGYVLTVSPAHREAVTHGHRVSAARLPHGKRMAGPSRWTNAPVVIFARLASHHGGVTNNAGITGALVHADTLNCRTTVAPLSVERRPTVASGASHASRMRPNRPCPSRTFHVFQKRAEKRLIKVVFDLSDGTARKA